MLTYDIRFVFGGFIRKTAGLWITLWIALWISVSTALSALSPLRLHLVTLSRFPSQQKEPFTLVEHTVCFGRLPNLLHSPLCFPLCGLSLCLLVLPET